MSDPQVRTRLVRFGAFELNLLVGELRRGGVRINLPDQLFQLLAALVERPDEIVTRDELRERLWGGQTFVDFDRGLNAAVKRLRDVLGDSAERPRFVETVPRRGYRFLGPVERAEDAATSRVPPPPPVLPADPDPERTHRHRLGWTVLAAGVATVLAAWSLHRSATVTTAAVLRVIPLTSMKGYEGNPSFSPDGKSIAFAHADNGSSPNWGVYVLALGEHEPRRLSPDHGADDLADVSPSWSPDGQRIAFLRRTGDSSPVYVMSAFGSGASKITDLAARPRLSWSPDSAFVLAALQASEEHPEGGISAIPVGGGPSLTITRARFPVSHVSPVMSGDGRTLAYGECRGPDDEACDILLLDLTAQLAPTGRPRLVTRAAGVDRISWGPDDHTLIFGNLLSFLPCVWRVDTDGRHVPERLELGGVGAWTPTVSRIGEKLAFSSGRLNPAVYQYDAVHGSRPLVESSFADSDAHLSTDGRFVALSSTRSGDAADIWVADANGQNAHQVTRSLGLWQGSPQWSPDGRALVFDSMGSDLHWHVWSVDPAGGQPRQLTHGEAEHLPTWSSDGRWIYYSRHLNSRHTELWKLSVDGRSQQRVDRPDAGGRAQESGDGKALVFQTTHSDGPLMMAPMGHGPSTQIASCARYGAFAVKNAGIVYVACGQSAVAHWMDLDGRHDRVIGTLDGFVGVAVDASPDSQTIIYDHLEPAMEFDVYLIEHFK